MKIINKYLCFGALAALGFSSCKKELNVGNPNQATIANNVTNESGLLSLANGGIYLNGFGDSRLGWLGNSYFSLPYGYSELLGDNVGAEAANQIVNIINIPDYYILDDGTRITNVATHRSVMRRNNSRAATGQGNNPTYYHWTSLYALNNACNQILELVDGIPMSGDAATKRNTIKAFCYFWKGWAYQQIGSQYYAGLIVNSTTGLNGNYKTSAEIIAESNSNFNRAATILGSITANADYTATLGTLIPAFCQVGNGGVLTPAEFVRNINTMLARNIVVNKLNPFVNGNPSATITGASAPAMTAADWNQVKTLCSNGIRQGDKVFTGRTVAVNGFFSATSGSVAAQATNPNRSSTFKVSERLIQNFKAGDRRLSNNFNTSSTFTSGGPFGTRYSQIDGGLGTAGVYVYGARAVGAYELYMAGSYEENALMLAEAEIELGNINPGLAYVDAVRAYQGANIAAVSGTGLTVAQAMDELTRERRVALVYRGLSFFDARRWGWIYDIAKGGGYYKGVVLNGTTPNTNVTLNYNFLDYWDVPADEVVLNPPAAGSAAVVNPN
jgi:starch-binding outer membrane protein, SusD/RagB family